MNTERIAEIKERLSIEQSTDDYKLWRISDIAKLRLDAKWLIKEIESLQAQLVQKDEFFREWCSGEDQYQQTVSRLDCANIKIAELESQLAASQRREKAAVEDLADFIIENEDSLRVALDTQDRDYLERVISARINTND